MGVNFSCISSTKKKSDLMLINKNHLYRHYSNRTVDPFQQKKNPIFEIFVNPIMRKAAALIFSSASIQLNGRTHTIAL